MAHKSKTKALEETSKNTGLARKADTRGLTRLTAQNKRRFCKHLARYGNVAAACRLVGISRVTAYAHKKKDPGFAAAWHEAREAACDAVEQSLLERAQGKWEEPVWYKGQEVGKRAVYSDTAALFFLKGRRPEIFAQGPQGTAGAVTVHDNRVQIAGLPDDVLEQAVAKRLESMGLGNLGGLESGGGSEVVDAKEPAKVSGSEPE